MGEKKELFDTAFTCEVTWVQVAERNRGVHQVGGQEGHRAEEEWGGSPQRVEACQPCRICTHHITCSRLSNSGFFSPSLYHFLYGVSSSLSSAPELVCPLPHYLCPAIRDKLVNGMDRVSILSLSTHPWVLLCLKSTPLRI